MPGAFYTERIKHFSFKVEGGSLVEAKLERSFGEPDGEGRLWVVESIIADPAKGRLYIADEEGPSVGIKVYNMDGKYTGQMLDTKGFAGQPEGIAIYEKGESSYLVTTDQQTSVSVFHIFDRETLKPIIAFKGKTTANTDGIAVSSTKGFASGGLWAIHDDQALVAFDWEHIQALIQQ
jgi:3-phytase